MDRSRGQLAAAYVGNRVYGASLRLKAERLRRGQHQSAAMRMAVAGDDEVSEEIVVYGESDDPGGGGTDVLTLDPWMFEFHIEVAVPPLGIPNPSPTPGDDTPEEDDPCTSYRQSLAMLEASLAADQTALKALDELIANADTRAEKKALREEKRALKQTIKDTEQTIEDLQAAMNDEGC